MSNKPKRDSWLLHLSAFALYSSAVIFWVGVVVAIVSVTVNLIGGQVGLTQVLLATAMLGGVISSGCYLTLILAAKQEFGDAEGAALALMEYGVFSPVVWLAVLVSLVLYFLDGSHDNACYDD